MSVRYSLEMWYYTAVVILVGCLKNPEIQVGAISIWSVLISATLFQLVLSSCGICLCISLRTVGTMAGLCAL